MFKKHVFTCPDVIYLRKQQKKLAYANLGVTAVFVAGLWGAGIYLENQDKKKYPEPDLTPTEE